VSGPGTNIRRLAITAVVIGCAAATAGCSAASHSPHPPPPAPRTQPATDSPAAARIPDPVSIAQIESRTLGPEAEPGFAFFSSSKAIKSTAMPFDPPTGTADHVCNALLVPNEFLPQPLLDSGVSVFPRADRSSPSAANWFESVDAYAAGESVRMEAQLRALLGRCGHFRWAVPTSTPIYMRAIVKSLPGIGDSTTYVSIRIVNLPPGTPTEAWDWVVIRSGNTLVTLDDQGSRVPSVTAQNTIMTQLVNDAWQRYMTGS
jgi:hypothetical protein